MSDLRSPSDSQIHIGTARERFRCEVRFSRSALAWICVWDELRLNSAQEFAQSVEWGLSGALLVVVDLRQLTAIDSTGLHVLIEADARARRSGQRLVVVRGPAHIDRLFELVGLSDRLEIIEVTPASYRIQRIQRRTRSKSCGHAVPRGR